MCGFKQTAIRTIPAYMRLAMILYHKIATGQYWVASLIILSQYAAAKVGASLANSGKK